MVTLSKNGNAIVFEFEDNSRYLYNGTIEVPINSLTLVTDESEMAVFKKSASNDVFLSALYSELGMTKAELEEWFKENAVGSYGSEITPEDVEEMIEDATEDYFDGVEYVSAESKINFKHGTTVKGYIDASPFIVDGMVDNVAIVGNNLVITFNVDSGKQPISIPLTDIFNPSNYYTKTEVDNALSGKADTSAVTEAITAAVSGKVDTSTFETYSGSVETALSGKADIANVYAKSETSGATQISTALNAKQDTLSAGTNITISGNVISAEGVTVDTALDSGSTNPVENRVIYNKFDEVEEVTAAALNELNDDVSGINDALSGKQDTLIAGDNITISGNVISADGGGKAIEAGRGISITTGETADTVSFNLPISAGTGENSFYGISNNNVQQKNSFALGSGNTITAVSANLAYSFFIGNNNSTQGGSNTIIGRNNGIGLASNVNIIIGGYNGTAQQKSYNYIFGERNYSNAASGMCLGFNDVINNDNEIATGIFNVSNTGSTNADKTAFSVGNGTANNARHNAFEIRKNGDIYITLDGQDVKLQDNLGGGEVSSAITSGDTNAVAGGAVYDRFDEVEQVTAAALNALNDALSGKADTSAVTTVSDALTAHTANTTVHTTAAEKTAWDGAVTALGGLKLQQLTQAQYDALATKDNSTVYIIVN